MLKQIQSHNDNSMYIIGNLMFITTNAQHIDLMKGWKIKVKAEIESSI